MQNDTTATRSRPEVEQSTAEPFLTCPRCGKGAWQSSIAAGQCLGCAREAAINRAVARAHAEAHAGHLPALLSSDVTPDGTRQTWAISSRTRSGRVYLVDLLADHNGVETMCQCEAHHAGRICFHRAACRLALFGDIGHHDARGHDGDPDELAELLVWWGQQPDPSEPADWTAVA